MSVTAISLSLLISHAAISGILLSRKAKVVARWHIPLYWTVLGQFVVSVVALAVSCVLAAAIAVTNGLGDATFLVLAVALFLAVCAVCQFVLVPRLAARERYKFLGFWTLRRLSFSTASTILVVYFSVGMVAFGAWYYVDQTTLRAEMQAAQRPVFVRLAAQPQSSPPR